MNDFIIPFSSYEQEKFIAEYNKFLYQFNFSMDKLTTEQQKGLMNAALFTQIRFIFLTCKEFSIVAKNP